MSTPASPELAACILLAGGWRPAPIVAATGASVLDLWIAPDATVLDCWLERLAELPRVADGQTPVRIISSPAQPPLWPRPTAHLNLSFELEPRAFRGTAGLLHDVCREYSPDAHVLVAEAGRYAACDIAPLWRQHTQSGADITLACNGDGALAGLYLARCDCLRDVPGIGYTDFKEQFLARAATAGRVVRSAALPGRGAQPIRNRIELLHAASLASNAATSVGEFAPTTGLLRSAESYGLQILCTGARVADGVTLVDSILMPGATVEPDCCLVRSIVCSGCSVQAGTDIADAVIGPRGLLSDRCEDVSSGPLVCTV